MPKQKVQQTKKGSPMLVAIVLGLATIVGGIAATLAFLPRISISVSDPVDNLNAFSATFTIINNNFIPLRDVGTSLGVYQIVMGGNTYLGSDANKSDRYTTKITKSYWQNHNLDMDERFTLNLSEIFNIKPVTHADIAIIVSYNPWILPIKREKTFRFILRKHNNGLYYWSSYPIK